MRAVFRREFKSFFTTPIGYVVIAAIFCVSGVLFKKFNLEGITLQGGSTNLSYVYIGLFYVSFFVMPFLTMRLFSEEKHQKTDQALFTAPTGLTGIVLGKFFAALALFALALSITLVYALIIALKATPDWLVIAGNFLGLLLVGGMMIAIGLLISALTESQVIAALGTLMVSLFFVFCIDGLAPKFSAIPWLYNAITFLSISNRYSSFTIGLIEYDNIIFFLSLQALFIFITVRVLDSKRWK